VRSKTTAFSGSTITKRWDFRRFNTRWPWADTQVAFQLVDPNGNLTGYDGAISYTVPTAQIDPNQAS
jgi:hypothetical protein